MSGGHNTDLRHGGRVFHVQTEDLGTGLETRVYRGGEILHIRRDDPPTPEAEPDLRRARLAAQHQRVLDEIREGGLDAEGPDPFGDRPLVEAVLEFLAKDAEVPPEKSQ